MLPCTALRSLPSDCGSPQSWLRQPLLGIGELLLLLLQSSNLVGRYRKLAINQLLALKCLASKILVAGR